MLFSAVWKRPTSSTKLLKLGQRQRCNTLATLNLKLDNTFVTELQKDPGSDANFPNREERAVRNGHWVQVKPMPLENPQLLAYSSDMTRRLGLSATDTQSRAFLDMFSGAADLLSWSTVAGNPIVADRFQGYSYGDGRAISIGQVINKDEQWELQLKGGGRTPFSRGFDGRAVLRSSIREFLVQEAMHWLSVPTTRSVSLVMSNTEKVHRAWYDDAETPTRNVYPPNRLVMEQCAITTRASSSFIRVGHLELFSRRLGSCAKAEEQLQGLLKHVLKREFSKEIETVIDDGGGEEVGKGDILEMVRVFAKRQAKLVTEWIRVGYVQGNMNSDNCLLCGRTMDYGPFGFMGQYHPLWSPFTSDPARNFGFERQPVAVDIAAHVQLATLANAVVPLLQDCEESMAELRRVVEDDYANEYLSQRSSTRARKLGVTNWTAEDDKELWDPLHKLLQDFDYTIFFRQLSTEYAHLSVDSTDSDLLAPLIHACYNEDMLEGRVVEKNEAVIGWLRQWIDRADLEANSGVMIEANPKYIPREWMLHEAYTKAQEGDHSGIHELQELFLHPYAEQPRYHLKYYQKTPPEMQDKAGIAFYS